MYTRARDPSRADAMSHHHSKTDASASAHQASLRRLNLRLLANAGRPSERLNRQPYGGWIRSPRSRPFFHGGLGLGARMNMVRATSQGRTRPHVGSGSVPAAVTISALAAGWQFEAECRPLAGPKHAVCGKSAKAIRQQSPCRSSSPLRVFVNIEALKTGVNMQFMEDGRRMNENNSARIHSGAAI
jgi:hypothetical protein